MIRSECVQGLQSFPLASGGFLMSFKVIKLWLSLWNILQFVRVIVPHKNSKISLRRNQDPDPSLHYWFLAALPTPVHLLNYLISNCENVPFGTQVMGHGVCSLQTRNRGQRGFFAQEPHRVLLSFTTINMCLCSSYRTFLGLSFSSLKRGFY